MKKSLSGLCVAVACGMCANASAADYSARPEVRAYIDTLVSAHNFERESLNRLFKSVTQQTAALKAMDRQAEAKPWYEYKQIFIGDERISKGVDFWKAHRGLFARVEREYLVPASVVLAIAGVETYYGGNLGQFPVFDTLATLGFDYARRASFFRNELTEMLLLGREENFDYSELKGSFSGAVGFSQFMPSSYRYYAVDFDGNGKRDLWHTPDALASIANYLARHGWKRGGAVANRVVLKGRTDSLPLNKDIKPWLSRSDTGSYGIESVAGLADSEPLFSLLAFELEDGAHEHWATYHNFYVISRYNHSRRYAMVIYQLSEILRQRYLMDISDG